MSSENRDTSFFPIMIHFISFSCLIVLTRTSSTVLNKTGESGRPCLVPDLRGKAFSHSSLSMLAMGLSKMAFFMLKYISSMPNLLRVFILDRC